MKKILLVITSIPFIQAVYYSEKYILGYGGVPKEQGLVLAFLCVPFVFVFAFSLVDILNE